jgi:hypothetical protein
LARECRDNDIDSSSDVFERSKNELAFEIQSSLAKKKPKMYLVTFLLLFLSQTLPVFSNTEKVIFLAPSPIQIPTTHPTLEDLHLHALTPQNTTQRTHLRAAFPTTDNPDGIATWLLLDKLTAGQRYEVRICWAATQPTSFDLSVYELEKVFSSPELITSLAQFSATRQPSLGDETNLEQQQEQAKQSVAREIEESMLFLRILAKADYYTMDQALMENVPPVYVDVILDPFLMNVFPKSLVPTAIYIVVLAVGAWVLGKWVSAWILNIQKQDEVEKEKKDS